MWRKLFICRELCNILERNGIKGDRKMTPKVFFKNLDLTAIVRKSTEKEKSAKLEEGDAEKLCSIIEMETPESCLEYSNAIVHAFQKFRVLPQLSVNGIETKVLK